MSFCASHQCLCLLGHLVKKNKKKLQKVAAAFSFSRGGDWSTRSRSGRLGRLPGAPQCRHEAELSASCLLQWEYPAPGLHPGGPWPVQQSLSLPQAHLWLWPAAVSGQGAGGFTAAWAGPGWGSSLVIINTTSSSVCPVLCVVPRGKGRPWQISGGVSFHPLPLQGGPHAPGGQGGLGTHGGFTRQTAPPVPPG